MRNILGLILLATQLALLIPLIWHTFRSKSGAGVSLSGEAIWAVAGLGWIAYGVLFESWTITASGSIAFLGCGILTTFLWRTKTSSERKSALLLSLVTVVGIAGSLAIFGKEGVSLSLAIFGIVQFIPQTVYSIRVIASKSSAAGVSVTASFMRSLYTLGWAIYAGAWFLWGMSFGSIDLPLVAWGLAGVIAFTVQGFSALQPKQILETV